MDNLTKPIKLGFDEMRPSYDLAIEAALLGAVLVDRETMDTIDGYVSSEDFYRPAHTLIFSAFQHLRRGNQPIDLLSLSDTLSVSGNLEAVGGRTYLAELTTVVATSAQAVYYAKATRLHAIRRQVLYGLLNSIERVNSSDDPVTLMLEASSPLAKATSKGKSLDGFQLAEELMESLDEKQIPAAKTGLPQFDEKLGFLNRGEMSVWAAAPGVGKTAMALQVTLNAMEMGSRVLFVSAEMSTRELSDRVLQRKTGIDLKPVRRGARKLSRAEQAAVSDFMGWYSEKTFRVFQTPSCPSPILIRSELVRMRAKSTPADLVVVDFISLFYNETSKKNDNRTMELDIITQMLRDFSKEFNCHVMALSQLNRDGQKSVGGEPSKHHLRDSGAIEANANQIMLMWADPNNAACLEQIVHVKVDKNRNGPLVRAKCNFDGFRFTFTEL